MISIHLINPFNAGDIFSNNQVELVKMMSIIHSIGYPLELMFGSEMLQLVGINSISDDSIEFSSEVWSVYNPASHSNNVGVYFKSTYGHIYAPNAKPHFLANDQTKRITVGRIDGLLKVYTGKTVNSFKSRFADKYRPEFHAYAGVQHRRL